MELIFSVLFGLILVKLGSVYIQSDLFYQKRINIVPERYPIIDRSGQILACTEETMSIYIDPMQFASDELLEEMYPGVSAKLAKSRATKSRFLWVERHASSENINKVRSMKAVGIYTKADFRRSYVEREVFSTLLGFCDSDLRGRAGLEALLDANLVHKALELTIDVNMQVILHTILAQSVSDYDAEGGSGIVVEVETGKILAMTSVPSPELPIDFIDPNKRNRNFDPVEVGSVLKLINIAHAIGSGKYSPESIVDGRGPLRIGKHEVNDFFGVDRLMTVAETLVHSSNIGNARIAMDLGYALQRDFFQKVGLLDGLEWVPGYKLRPIKPKWSKTTGATLSYGYGIGLTTLHLARSILRIITGYECELSLFANHNTPRGQRILSQTNVKQILSMMKSVAKKNRRLNIPGYDVGAKTGTANMLLNGKYVEGCNFVTLVNVYPADNPKLLIILQMSYPKQEKLKYGKYAVAGNVLGPCMQKLLPKIVREYQF